MYFYFCCCCCCCHDGEPFWLCFYAFFLHIHSFSFSCCWFVPYHGAQRRPDWTSTRLHIIILQRLVVKHILRCINMLVLYGYLCVCVVEWSYIYVDLTCNFSFSAHTLRFRKVFFSHFFSVSLLLVSKSFFCCFFPFFFIRFVCLSIQPVSCGLMR